MGNAATTPGRECPDPKVYQILLPLGCIPRKECSLLMNGKSMRYEDSLAWLPHSKGGFVPLRGCFACVDQRLIKNGLLWTVMTESWNPR